MFSGPLEDRTLIRERQSAYADAVFRGDIEAWLACYSDDGVWFVHGAEHRGKAALRAHYEKLFAPIERMAFFPEVTSIEVHGERAGAHCYCREILKLKTGDIRKVVGHYQDQLERHNGVWLFARRDYNLFMAESVRKL